MLAHIIVGTIAASVASEGAPAEVTQSRLYVVTGLPLLNASIRNERLYAVVGANTVGNLNSQNSSLYAVVTE